MNKISIICKFLFVFGGFLCYMFADGCTFSIGILYNEFLKVFHESKAETAVLPGLIYSLPQISAPIICPIVDTIGSAYSALIGSLLLFTSFFVSQFVVSLQLMYFTIGFLASIGLEMTYVSGIMAVTKGFADGKYLGLALGITVSGSGIGVFIFNPLLTTLISEYLWRGALFLESSMFLEISIAGVLFKLAYTLQAYQTVSSKYNKDAPSINTKSVPKVEIITRRPSEVGTRNVLTHAESVDAITSNKNSNENIVRHKHIGTLKAAYLEEKRSSVVLSLTQTNRCEPFVNPISHQLRAASFDRRLSITAHPSVPPQAQIPPSPTVSSTSTLPQQPSDLSQNTFNTNTNINNIVSIPVDQNSVTFVNRLSNLFPSHYQKTSLSNSQASLSSQTVNKSEITNDNVDNHYNDNDNQPLTPGSSSNSKCNEFQTALSTSILSMFSEQLWTNKRFLWFLFLTFCLATSVVIPWTFSFDHSLSLGIKSNQASFLISMIGVGSCIGQILFGILSDYVPAITLYSGGVLITGIITILLRWISNYWVLIVFHFIFGFCQGVTYALFSVIIIYYLGLPLYSPGLGIYLLLSGSGNLIGTTIAGHINDITGSYAVVYLIAGGILIGVSFMSLPLCWLWHHDIAKLGGIDRNKTVDIVYSPPITVVNSNP